MLILLFLILLVLLAPGFMRSLLAGCVFAAVLVALGIVVILI